MKKPPNSLSKQNLFKLIFCNFYYHQVVKINQNLFKPLPNMHTLQPKHSKLSEKETDEVLRKLNVSKSQLPKIFSSDPALPENISIGDVIKIERKTEDGKTILYYRVAI